VFVCIGPSGRLALRPMLFVMAPNVENLGANRMPYDGI
jgi:hypothetical protein